jgi:DNA-directed RNA polymerase specialized sigma24 family protein
MNSLGNRDEEAATIFYTRYIGKLIKLASQKLDPRLGARVDPETVAHTVIKLFFDKFQKKEIEFENWEALYGYLAKVTIRKALNRNRLHWQLKRGGGAANLQSNNSDQFKLEEIFADNAEPDPAEVAEINDTIKKAMEKLKPNHRVLVEDFLRNNSQEKTAEVHGVALRTVQRAVTEFREEIQRLSNIE